MGRRTREAATHDTPVRIGPKELADHADGWRVLDASWIFPPLNAAGIDVRRRYADAHPPGAMFLDLATLGPSAWPDVAALTLPPPGVLHAALAAVGIDATSPIVVTDMDGGTTTAPFARLALIDAGFATVRLLDGGTPAWQAAGLPLTAADPVCIGSASGPPRRAFGWLVDTETTARAREAGLARLIDARFAATNAGILPPRFEHVTIPTDAVLRPGEVTEETSGGLRFIPAAQLRTLARTRGLDDGRPVITTCHFGLAAAAVATALEIAGVARPRVDMASILGWAARQDR